MTQHGLPVKALTSSGSAELEHATRQFEELKDQMIPPGDLEAMRIKLIDETEGALASALGEHLREGGAVRHVLRLLEHRNQNMHQLALLVLGNLSSDAVDEHSWVRVGRHHMLIGPMTACAHVLKRQECSDVE